MFPDNSHPDQYLWQSYAMAALQGMMAQAPREAGWRLTDAEVVARAGNVGALMVTEHRRRFPLPTVEEALEPAVGHPEYDLFVRVAKSVGLTEVQATEIWLATETAHDSWLGLISRMEEAAKAPAVGLPVVDGNGHSLEATGYIDPDNGQYVGPSNSRNPHIEYPTLPDMFEPEDPHTGMDPDSDEWPEDGPTRGAGGVGCGCSDCLPKAVDSFIANGAEYRRNEGGSYEAYRSVDPEELAGQDAATDMALERERRDNETWADRKTRQMQEERLAERIDHRIAGDRSEL